MGTTEPKSDKAAALAAKITRLRDAQHARRARILRTEREIASTTVDLAKEQYGVEEGTVVVGKNGLEGRVCVIEAQSFIDPLAKPWIRVNPRKKDGTWSKQVRHVYGDWEVAS